MNQGLIIALFRMEWEGFNMGVCCCQLAGTNACRTCPNNNNQDVRYEVHNPIIMQIPQYGWICPKCGKVLNPIYYEHVCGGK